jgi:hypothetical protein
MANGNVEGLVGTSRRNVMVPVPRFANWDVFNTYLEEQCRRRQADVLRGQSETIGERLARDLAAMSDLPAAPFDACDQATGRVSSQAPPLGHASMPCRSMGALQDQRLLGAGRLRPPRRLDQGLRGRGRDRLRGRDHRPSSALLRPRGHGRRSGALPSADRAQDKRSRSGGALGRTGQSQLVFERARPRT